MEGIYENTYNINYYDVDKTNNCTVIAIAEYMEETSSKHCEYVNCGMKFLGDRQQGWILIEVHTKILRLPKLGDKIISRTWSLCCDRLFAYRQYEIVDEFGNQICVSTSKWIIYSAELKLPVRIDEGIYSKYTHVEKEVIENKYIHIKDNGNYIDQKPAKILYRDIDTNWHMNNIKYLRYAIESMGIGFLELYTVEEYSVRYIHQLIYDTNIKICINKITENEYMYYIKENSDNENMSEVKSNADIYIKWRKK